MKVGLVRHFKVKKGFPEKKLLTVTELVEWFEEYDAADIEEGETDLGDIEWQRCLTSDMPRAVKTAEKIYRGNIIRMKELREIPLPQFKINMRLPFLVWAILVKVSWMMNHKTRLEIEEVKRRISTVFDRTLLEGGRMCLL
ncbi:histidine phosphatase family protein [Aneurinibacillus tyrosinisolvens]|uniref:histidine phosphatase family protein n=1 Tax=Aneurinibacillus tyrosinisolvens TaxID=1443435 RepID=UPI000AFD5343|nr:histidine phosphatase family protein [Aneurinibacillus tyrosinisolvens]